ncbi:hypothetical protein [Bilophila wadsworthia]|uniref:hypothetical protein n=1 Tax=Bilophila wadsworthia TaxID=35833 RepID=UPI003AB712B5
MRQRPVSILCLLALFCLLAACSPKQDKKQEFMDHWKQLSQDSQGYSPAPSDLRPEPRVIMRHTEKQEQAASRPLPTIPVTLKLHNVDVGVALRSLAAAAGVNVMLSPGVSGTVSLNVQKSPWRDVFQGLLRANGLQYRWQGNILQVLTAVENRRKSTSRRSTTSLPSRSSSPARTRRSPSAWSACAMPKPRPCSRASPNSSPPPTGKAGRPPSSKWTNTATP